MPSSEASRSAGEAALASPGAARRHRTRHASLAFGRAFSLVCGRVAAVDCGGVVGVSSTAGVSACRTSKSTVTGPRVEHLEDVPHAVEVIDHIEVTLAASCQRLDGRSALTACALFFRACLQREPARPQGGEGQQEGGEVRAGGGGGRGKGGGTVNDSNALLPAVDVNTSPTPVIASIVSCLIEEGQPALPKRRCAGCYTCSSRRPENRAGQFDASHKLECRLGLVN